MGNFVPLLILMAQIKRHDTIITAHQTPALWKPPFLKKSTKICQKLALFKKKCNFGHFLAVFLDFFRKCVFLSASVFLRCIQCIQTLNLSYQSQRSDKISHFPKKSCFSYSRISLLPLK